MDIKKRLPEILLWDASRIIECHNQCHRVSRLWMITWHLKSAAESLPRKISNACVHTSFLRKAVHVQRGVACLHRSFTYYTYEFSIEVVLVWVRRREDLHWIQEKQFFKVVPLCVEESRAQGLWSVLRIERISSGACRQYVTVAFPPCLHMLVVGLYWSWCLNFSS